ncbi:PAS domain S-box-containing protein [Rhizobium sp. PP-CC-3G-465]|nr:PAS domain S-box-containing protein [Rhizobium sp. PP-CC-3G-465]
MAENNRAEGAGAISAADASQDAFAFLGKGGEIRQLIRNFDWSATPLGRVETWPGSLRTATALLLQSPVPIVMLWGEHGIMIYNDAYSGFAGTRHPQLLGSRVREGWAEIAEFNDNVMKVGLSGGTLAYRDQELTLHRRGVPEQVWMNLDYSPVLDETGTPAGVIAIVVETTREVLARQRIAREHERLLQLFAQAPTFMAMLRGENHVFELVNPNYQALIGNRDVIGKPVSEALPELADQGFGDLLDEAYRSGEPVSRWSERLILVRSLATGPEERFVDFVYQPITADSGEVTHIFVQGSDVTERVIAEHRQRLLVNELNHRVKNTLASVQAITSQTLRGAMSLKEASDSINGRILALSRAHNMLTAQNWTGADLNEVLETALSTHDDPDRPQLDVTSPPLRLEPHAALSLALALYELAINAAKFGALSRTEGRVEIICETVVVDDRDVFRMTWREIGGPPVHAPQRRGFGSHLLERALPAELSGQVRIHHRPDGLVFELAAPLSAIREGVGLG